MRSAPHQCVRADPRRSPRGEQGQVLPLMIVLMILLLAAGMIVFWLGFSTSLGASAQTAADAAALSGEQAAMNYIETDPPDVLDAASLNPVACHAAGDYATRNNAHVTYCQVVESLTGFDTKVIVTTNDKLPAGGPDSGNAASAKARASTDPFSQGSPTIRTSVSTSCDASVVSGPVYQSHPTDKTGFFPADGTNYGSGCEPKLAGAIDKFAKADKLKLDGTSGFVGENQTNSKDPAAVAHACGDASTTTGIPKKITDAELKKFGLVRPFANQPDVIELAGVSCNQQSSTVDASASGSVGLGNMNVHLVPWGGGPEGTFSFFGGGGGISIGESALQVGCQIFGVWRGLDLSQRLHVDPSTARQLLFVALITAQDESAMGQNVGFNRTDPNQSVGVFQQISADGWGTIPEELNVSTAAAMFFEGGHIGASSSTQGLIQAYGKAPWEINTPWELAQDTQVSGAGQDSHGAANYGAQPNMLAAQQMLGEVTSGKCPKA